MGVLGGSNKLVIVISRLFAHSLWFSFSVRKNEKILILYHSNNGSTSFNTLALTVHLRFLSDSVDDHEFYRTWICSEKDALSSECDDPRQISPWTMSRTKINERTINHEHIQAHSHFKSCWQCPSLRTKDDKVRTYSRMKSTQRACGAFLWFHQLQLIFWNLMLHQTLPECYNKCRVQLTFRRANSCLIKYRLAQLMYVAALHDWWNGTIGDETVLGSHR